MYNTKILGKIIVVKLVRICHLKIVFCFFIRPFYLKSGRIGRLLAIKTKKAENISITRLNMSYSIFCFQIGLWGDFLFSRKFKSIQYRKIPVFHLQNRTVKNEPLKKQKSLEKSRDLRTISFSSPFYGWGDVKHLNSCILQSRQKRYFSLF